MTLIELWKRNPFHVKIHLVQIILVNLHGCSMEMFYDFFNDSIHYHKLEKMKFPHQLGQYFEHLDDNEQKIKSLRTFV